MKRIIKRFTDRNKLSYWMNIAFGLCLLVITIQFQFGKTVITTPSAIIHLNQGYITERSQIIRAIEGLLAIGLITLGAERLRSYNRRFK